MGDDLTTSSASSIAELSAKVQFLVDFLNERGLLEDGAFAFPDGDIWHATTSVAE